MGAAGRSQAKMERGAARSEGRPRAGHAGATPVPANPLWSRLARGGSLQAKLKLGAVDDPLERDADRVAEAVVSGLAPPAVQRKCAACEEEEMHRSPAELPAEDEEEKLQTKRSSGATPEVSPKTASRIASFRGGGEALSPAARSYFEPRFSRDLSGVRLHTGGEASAAAGEVQARAFTVGSDIAFGAGEYRPETVAGKKLLAHELTHTVQQGAADALRRKPKGPEDDPIHQPIIEQYRREWGLPESGIDPQTGKPVGPSPAAIKYGRAPWPGDVAAPKTTPSLAAVPDALSEASCGKVTPGMDPAKAEVIRDCITHARFVNFMNQSIANIAQVASPYAPGIASVYQAALAEVVKAGLTSPPTATTAKTYTVKNLTVTVSPGVTLTIASFDLKLQRTPGGANGANFGSGIELNEESGAALIKDQADIERTMYHEGFHWLSGEVSSHNRSVRGGTKGTIVSPELDYTLVKGFETEFRAAAEPIWKDVLATVPLKLTTAKPLTPQALSGIQWIKVANEILSRVEEAVYLNLRQGKGFSRKFDLPVLAQGWLLTSDYWDSGVIFVRADLQTFLTTNTDRVNRELLPVVQKIQSEYLRGRAKP
jgi:uncharacterized protein DUF4157